ncbi:DNA mismatch repair protein MutS [bacterium BMS3Abin14]|nr:DNA mismatch repair protein MutS [bacterium BMS3Abin14]
MFRDHDFDLPRNLPSNEQALTQDLELNTLFNAMALGDKFLFQIAKDAVLSGSSDMNTMLYRQDILKDCMKNPSIIREIYDISIESHEEKKKNWYGLFSRYPAGILYGSAEMLQMLVGLLKKLRKIAVEHADNFESEGFSTFFAMIKDELDDEYFSVIQNHLKALKFRDGVLISAELDEGNVGVDYILRRPHDRSRSWVQRIFTRKSPVYTFRIADRDDSGARALSELRDRGINLVANVLAQSSDHIENFFKMLGVELAFYVGCLNLYDQLAHIGGTVSFPLPVAAGERKHAFEGLFDVCLALTMGQKVVGNDVNADDKDCVIITGANQGGKSTFLRSIGLAQLMMQCGMFITAGSFSSNICEGLFTHYKREEDAFMESGKLDEELSRMSQVVDNVGPNSLLLLNESFSATNEREGSEIAKQITCALLESRVKVFFVTHLYEFAHVLYDEKMENALFLRAERQADGERTFKVVKGEPLETSYGEDLYRAIWG